MVTMSREGILAGLRKEAEEAYAQVVSSNSSAIARPVMTLTEGLPPDERDSPENTSVAIKFLLTIPSYRATVGQVARYHALVQAFSGEKLPPRLAKHVEALVSSLEYQEGLADDIAGLCKGREGEAQLDANLDDFIRYADNLQDAARISGGRLPGPERRRYARRFDTLLGKLNSGSPAAGGTGKEYINAICTQERIELGLRDRLPEPAESELIGEVYAATTKYLPGASASPAEFGRNNGPEITWFPFNPFRGNKQYVH